MNPHSGSTSKPPPRLLHSAIFTYDLPPSSTPLPAPIKMTQQDAEEDQTSHNFRSPTRAIKEWVPKCEESLVPKEGSTFDDLEQCEKFYKTYAHHVGFSVRKSSSKKDKQGVNKYKYFVCSKEGFRENSTNKSKGKAKVRQRKLTRVGCNALVGFKRTNDGKYVIHKFYEGHTHLPAIPKKRDMIKSNSRMKSVHRSLLKSFTHANVGPNKGHDLTKEQVGDLENVECSGEASKNFPMDLKAHINGSDAHMFVENLKRKKEVNKSFYFAYELDGDQGLKHVFWADGISRRNFTLYGDVVSFDITFDTNRYKMLFVSFTGLDSHRLCVTFGGAFLGDENVESFIWLFEKFLNAMGGIKPVCLLTDENHAVKLAVQRVFDTSTHKHCIWHMMRKLSEKVGCSLNSNVDFSTRFNSCVNNSETPVEFETTWQSIIKDFGLTENEWLSEIFAIREMWIPAYFRDLFLGGVLRTTSRSESEDDFFSNFTRPRLSLVEFWMQLESAIDLQRHHQAKADIVTSSMRQLKTDRDLEKHAARIYTHSNFYRFQHELWVACMDCEIEDKKEIQEGFLITIIDSGQKDGKTRQVIYNPLDHVAHCSCKMFEFEAIPCRHILCVLKAKIHELPNYYILNRWTKMASSKPFFNLDDNVLEGCSQVNQVDRLISENWMNFMTLMQVAGRDPKMLTLVSKRISSVRKQLMELMNNTCESKVQDVDSVTSSSASEPVESLPRRELNTEGSGKRIRERKETVTKQRKRRRLCRACGQQAYHDSRNCPSKVSSKPC